jgi:DNA-binding NarL/FixJ family response regulator
MVMMLRIIRAGTSPPRAQHLSRHRPYSQIQLKPALNRDFQVEARLRAMSAGSNMFMPKPVEPDKLIAAIADLADVATAQNRRV